MNTRKQVEDFARELSVRIQWNAPLREGDLYIAARNTGAQLLTCCRAASGSFVIPQETAYCYDTWECAKVVGEK